MSANQNYEPENIVFYHTPCFLIYDSPEFKEYPVHWHNAFEMIMPTENIFPVICGGKEYILKENELLIIPPAELHTLKAQQGRRIIMLCDNEMLKDNPALNEINMLFSEPVLIDSSCNSGFISELNGIIKSMLDTYNASPPLCETILFNHLITLFIKIAEYKKSSDMNKENNRNDKLILIKKYIDSRYTEPVTLDELADAIGYSKYHLSRILSSSGVSFADILNERRIRAAETMLHDESCPITRIALDSGFTSITTFNRIFRRIKGCTPTRFRQLYNENNM